jgi:hypothetical protein
MWPVSQHKQRRRQISRNLRRSSGHGTRVNRPAVDDELALRYVDPNNRVELDRFERWDEAALACGLLRSNDIACELSPMPLPGLPADIILWVHNRDAKLAWALLADAEGAAAAKNKDSN